MTSWPSAAAIGNLAVLRVEPQESVVDAIEREPATVAGAAALVIFRLDRTLDLRRWLRRDWGTTWGCGCAAGCSCTGGWAARWPSTSITACADATEAEQTKIPAKASIEARMFSSFSSTLGISERSIGAMYTKPERHWSVKRPGNGQQLCRFRASRIRGLLPVIKHLCRGAVSLTRINAISMVRAAFRAAEHAKPEIHASRKHG